MDIQTHASTSDGEYLIVPKEEMLDDLVLSDHSEDDTDAAIPKEEPSDTSPHLDYESNEPNVGIVMPIKTELTLSDNIAQLRRQHESAEHESVSDKEMIELDIKTEPESAASVNADCMSDDDTPLLKKYTQNRQGRHVLKKELLPCDMCQKQFQYKHDLVLHKRSHTDPHWLKKCTQNHRSEAAGELGFPLCNVCGKQFKYRSDLVVHMRTHADDQSFTCGLCREYFVNGYLCYKCSNHFEIPFTVHLSNCCSP